MGSAENGQYTSPYRLGANSAFLTEREADVLEDLAIAAHKTPAEVEALAQDIARKLAEFDDSTVTREIDETSLPPYWGD